MTGERHDAVRAVLLEADAAASRGEIDAALAALERALREDPDPRYHFAYAELLHRAGRAAAAIQAMQEATRIAPALAVAWSRLGEWRLDAGDPGGAVQAFAHAAQCRPGHIPSFANLAVAQLRAGMPHEAEASARTALALDPAHPGARAALAHALLGQGALTRAADALADAAAANPHVTGLWLLLANTRLNIARPAEALRAFDQALALSPRDAEQIASARLLAMHYEPAYGPGDLARAHRDWARRYAPPSGAAPAARPRAERLRLGYVSPRLHGSSAGLIFSSVLEQHDRERFDVVCYAASDVEDALTARMKGLAGGWRNVAHLDDAGLAALIGVDGIDIAIDLAGHTPQHRLGAFVRRPAPVCVTWLDYFDTTGLDCFDAILTDRWHTPEGSEQWYTEPVVRLPGLRLPWSPQAPAETRLHAPGGDLVFGSFSRMAKLSDATLDLWSEALRAATAARLVVKNGALDNPEQHERLRERFARRGIDPARVECRGQSAYAGMLDEYGDVDVVLDTLGYSGCVTTFEALSRGCPVLALSGATMASRQTAAILSACGLDRFIAADRAAFAASAAALSEAKAQVRADRRAVAGQLERSPVGDVRGFTRGLEDAYLGLWRQSLERRR